MYIPVPLSIHHVGHSSVIVTYTGQCLEIRRGSLRNFEIPNPFLWNSIQDWHSSALHIQYDLMQRPNPPHFNAEQTWMAQWHEYSTLTDEVYDQPVILILDSNTNQLISLYMNLDTGVMFANGLYFTQFAQTSIHVAQVWRWELGNYYRIY